MRQMKPMLALAALLATTVLFSSFAAAKAPKSFFGVGTQASLSDSDYSKMKHAKVHTLRVPLYWQTAEPHPSQFNFAGYDAIVAQAAKRGIRVLPVLFGTPHWVAKQRDHRKCGHCGPYAPRSAKALKAWQAFTRKAAARYGPGGRFWKMNPGLHREPIRVWQIWNEQNSKTFFKPKPDPRRYAKLLRSARRGIHAKDRKADLILGGTFGTAKGHTGNHSIPTVTYLRKLYRVRGVKRDFSGIALHPYSSKVSSAAYQVKLARRELKRQHDASTDIWVTEIGWASGGQKSPVNVGSKKAQAKRVSQLYRTFTRHRNSWNVKAVLWYAWQDVPRRDAGCFFCAKTGLVTTKGKAKPALGAFRRASR